MGLFRIADMQNCAMRLRDGRVSGIWLCGSDGYAPSRGFVVFTFYADRHMVLVSWFLSHLMPLRIWGLRIVEVQVLWITEDHGIILEYWRSGFVSSICFLRVCLVSGVFSWFDGDIYLLACP